MKPVVSKADPKGAFWCDKPIFFPYRDFDPICAAREFVQQELDFPVQEGAREVTPLFRNDNGKPFSKAQVDNCFKAMRKLVVPPAK